MKTRWNVSVRSRSNWNLEEFVFMERGKPKYPEKNLPYERREPTTNSTHIWGQRQNLNPGDIGGRRVLLPPGHSWLYSIFVDGEGMRGWGKGTCHTNETLCKYFSGNSSPTIPTYIQLPKQATKPYIYSYFEKGCRQKMCTRQSRKVIWDMINTLFLAL